MQRKTNSRNRLYAAPCSEYSLIPRHLRLPAGRIISYPDLLQGTVKKYLPTMLLLFLLMHSIGHAREHSVHFVSRLVSNHDYSLSPSGNFLLVKEPSATPFHYKHMSLQTIDETGLENGSPASSLKYEQAWWLLRNGNDELLGIRKGRLYRSDPRKTQSYISINVPRWMANPRIERLPEREDGRLIISSTEKNRNTRQIHSCEINSPVLNNCHVIGEHNKLTEDYVFSHTGEIAGRFQWSVESLDTAEFQVPDKMTTTGWRTVYSHEPARTAFRVIEPPDKAGRLLALSNRNRDVIALVHLDIRSGQETVVAENSYDMEENFQNKYTGEVLAISTFPGTHGIWHLHPSLEQRMQQLLEMTGRPTRISLLSTDSPNRRFIIRIESPRLGYAILLLHESGQVEYLEGNGKQTRPGYSTAYVPPEPAVIPVVTGPPLKALLTTPRLEPGPFPFVIMIHGGPRLQYRPRMNPLVQRLVSLGIAVLQLNYRGSSGYGKKYEEFIVADHRPFDSVERDVEIAHDWLVSKGIGRAGQAGLWGESFGATVAVQVASRAADQYPVVVLMNGLFDFRMFVNHLKGEFAAGRQGKIGDWSRYMGLQHLPKFSDRVAELLETGASIHPCFLASNLRSSTLMFAGTMDRITHPDQSLALHDELRARGIRSRLKLLNHGHSVTARRHAITISADSADFLYENLLWKSKVHRTQAEGDFRDNHGKGCLAPTRSVEDVLESGHQHAGIDLEVEK